MSDTACVSSGILSPFLPADPLMAQAWVDCLRWAMGEPDILDAFLRETGVVLRGSRSPIDRMIDVVCNSDEAVARRFVAWFDANVWGEIEGVTDR